VERSNRTRNEEFYELAHGQPNLAALDQQLRKWENTYNCVRHHQALAYLTPQEFLFQWKRKSKKAKCH
jgi:transposase InsO family protein